MKSKPKPKKPAVTTAKNSSVKMQKPASKQKPSAVTRVSKPSKRDADSRRDVLPVKTKTPAADPSTDNQKLGDLKSFKRDPSGQPMRTDQGIRISHTDDSLKAGTRGPSIIEDFHLREKITRFDHERIPERVVHARGSAAHGIFECYESMAEYTTAGFLQEAGIKTPVFTRFSTVLGSRGSADTVRDVRGFAVKFYTQEGNFDLVGNNIPVFFIQDGIKFPDLIHSGKPEAHHEIPGAATAHDTFWDFVSLTPESTHMLMWILSDRTLPRSYANMEGFGVHTFRFVNAKGKSRFVKFHWKPVLGVDSLVWDEAQKIAGKDPDFHRRNLWQSIELGQGPEFELGVQIIEEKDVSKFEFDLLDATKLVPEEQFPVKIIGKMTLNRNPDNFFAENEQVAYHVANLVPGIDVTNDPLMQARLFSYLDTQLTRLGGPNFAEIPINRPIPPVHNTQQDGFARQAIPQGRANYSPNSIGGGCPFMSKAKEGGYVHFPEPVEGTKTRERSPSFADHYSQAKMFFESLSDVEKQHIIDAACFELGKVEIEEIRERVLLNFMEVSVPMALEIAEKVGVDLSGSKAGATRSSKVKVSPALSQMNLAKDSILGRMVAVVVADGFSMNDVKALGAELEAEGARMEIIANRLGVIAAEDGEGIKADKSFLTAASVFYDAVYIPSGEASTAELKAMAEAIYFVQEAYQHCKTIAAVGDANEVLAAAGINNAVVDSKGDQSEEIAGVVTSAVFGSTDELHAGFQAELAKHRHWGRPERLMPTL